MNDAQSMYTGVYARGGPSVEQSSAVDLPHYLDRSEVHNHAETDESLLAKLPLRLLADPTRVPATRGIRSHSESTKPIATNPCWTHPSR